MRVGALCFTVGFKLRYRAFSGAPQRRRAAPSTRSGGCRRAGPAWLPGEAVLGTGPGNGELGDAPLKLHEAGTLIQTLSASL